MATNDFNVGQATELLMVIFARMNKGQRQAMIKLLKKARPGLDFKYPLGMQPQPPKATDGLILPSTEIVTP